ncbi:MAG: AbrB/MazE/SpoVT family DNA-binding domain-containing protein [Thermomicrobiales bacterium]|nr:AbrB/MazE/SpoVT family DNA-binding domain-containing protein [Thermomicrobiales bacterium]
MPIYSSSVSPKGQVTIPQEIREEFGIRAKDVVTFEVVEGRITLTPALAHLLDNYRSVPALDPPRSWQEIEAIVAEERALKHVAEPRSTCEAEPDQ